MKYLAINSRQGGAPHPLLRLIKAVVYTSCLFLTPWKQDFFGSGRTLSWQDGGSTADKREKQLKPHKTHHLPLIHLPLPLFGLTKVRADR